MPRTNVNDLLAFLSVAKERSFLTLVIALDPAFDQNGSGRLSDLRKLFSRSASGSKD
jgi:hypothetical protein